MLETALNVLFYLSFVAVPLFLTLIFWDVWVRYVQALYFAKQEYVLLEVKLPREIFKSPKAAEFFIAGLYQTSGEKNWYEKYWRGQVRAWFSLEIVSIDGVVHFYIWTKRGFRNTIEANLYSQYPGIEVFEVQDYTLPLKYDPEVSNMWVNEFKLKNPNDAFPIKTYIDYGMDKDPKEEFKIDPMTPLIEFLGSMSAGNQVWIQIIVRSHKAEDKDPLTGKMVDLKWEKAAQKAIDEILAKAKGEKGEDGKIIPGSTRFLTDVETETIKALGRSISKSPFDVGMRLIYIAPKDIFSLNNLSGIIGGIMHFNSQNLNGFVPIKISEERRKHFLLAWMKRSEKDRISEKQEILDAYKRRAYFHKPFKRPYFVLNSEEIATIYHFPGLVSATPTFSRIESKKGQAPSNLPI